MAAYSKTTFSLSTARKLLPQLLDRVEHGERISITRRGHVVALLSAPVKKKQAKKLRGVVIHITTDFDAPMDDDWSALS